MVEMSNSSLLVEHKPTYSKALQDPKTANFSMTKDSGRFLNGDVSYFSKERSNSVGSTDSHELDSLLEVADKIKTGKNGLQKPKKRVRFNMDNNQEFTYSYAVHNDSSDEEKFTNVHLFGYEYMNGDTESDDDDENDEDDYEDDEDDEDDEESDENDYDTETSEDGSYTSLGKYGYLVDKTSEREQDVKSCVNNNTIEVGEVQDEGDTTKVHESNRLNGKAEPEHDNEAQLEKIIQNKKDVVEGEIGDLTSQLVEFRKETQLEMNRLQNELELRRKQYNTEIEEITKHRQEQKRKFEEELEEFQNEKKLEERRQRYHEHERIINEKEEELTRRKAQVVEQEREIREYEEYLNRRHAVCNSKEEDLNVLQNELETLSRELEVNKERLLNKSLSYQKQLEDMDNSQAEILPLNDKLMRRASRVSSTSRGGDLRVEELKQQNKQLVEELFSLKKTLESKDEELGNSQKTIDVLGTENKRLLQKVKNLESQLELSRKTAEFYGSDTPAASVEEILRKNATEMRNSRVNRASRVHLEPLNITSSHSRLSRTNSADSEYSKLAKSSSSSESNGKVSSRRPNSGSSDEKLRNHSVKTGLEKTTSSLCVVM